MKFMTIYSVIGAILATIILIAPMVIMFFTIKAIVSVFNKAERLPPQLRIKPNLSLAEKREAETGVYSQMARLKIGVQRDVKLLHKDATYRLVQPEELGKAIMEKKAEIPVIILLPECQMVGKAIVIDGDYQRLRIAPKRKKASKAKSNVQNVQTQTPALEASVLLDPALQNPIQAAVVTPDSGSERTEGTENENSYEIYEPFPGVNWKPVADRWVRENQKMIEGLAQEAVSRNEDVIVIPAYALPDMQAWSAICEALRSELGLSDVEMEESLIRARFQ